MDIFKDILSLEHILGFHLVQEKLHVHTSELYIDCYICNILKQICHINMPAFISAIHTMKQTLQTKASNNIKVSGIHVWECTILNIV